jgi:SAM-dependent methyltransferase
MNTNVQLPKWLDDLIFEQLGAKYCRSNADMTVIDWDKNDVLNYLGTYFPRSYAESYCIFMDLFRNRHERYFNKSELLILDFGCGTGGEILGLLSGIESFLKDVSIIKIVGIDGNQHALRLLEKTVDNYKKISRLNITLQLAPITISNFYDLSILDDIIAGQFDIIMSFKAICEFVTKDQFEGNNPYAHIAKTYIPHLNNKGIMVLVDVTTYNNTSKEWLPNMLDKGLASVDCLIVSRNSGFNQTFYVQHSGTNGCVDTSKICWRIITKRL